jgi:YegS/Rv2252/BmrU family lipid kinase
MGKNLFIVNPGAAGGQGEIAWNRFRKLWPGSIEPKDVRITERPGHASEIATSTDGYDILTVVGGDGTVNEVFNGVMKWDGTHPSLAIIPAGTGNDIARTVGLFPLEAAVNALKDGCEQAFDIIRIDGQENGKGFVRHAFLTAGMGFSGSVTARPWTKRILGATLAYYVTTILAILAHRPPTMSARWSTGDYAGRTWMVMIGNVEDVSGGSMRIAPGASPQDGRLWVTIVEPKPKLTMLFKELPKVASGNHVNAKGFHFFSTQEIEITSDVPAVVDIDGEVDWATRATLRIVPGAVRILVPE